MMKCEANTLTKGYMRVLCRKSWSEFPLHQARSGLSVLFYGKNLVDN